MGTATPARLFSSSSVSASCPSVPIASTHDGNTDEAHKGKGDYAYAQIIRELMHRNPHFRVLALTATPGGKPEAVQEICDSLHISHIEIRDERSSDLKQHIFQKVCSTLLSPPEQFVDRHPSATQEIEQHIVNMSGDILVTRSLLASLMEVPRSLVVLEWVSNLHAVSRLSRGSRVRMPSRVIRIPSSYILTGAKRNSRESVLPASGN